MSSPILPITYLGPIQFYKAIVQAENITIESFENYTKQTYRNRCEIYGANGKLGLSIPIHKGNSSRTKIKDAKINYSERWQKVHWKSLESAYRRSPYFEYYEHEFSEFHNSQKHTFLFDYNFDLFKKTLSLLDINKEICFTSKFVKSIDESIDYRNIDPKDTQAETQNYKRYIQVFEDKKGFIPNLSIVDLLFNEGPNSKSYLLDN